jgi:hypothetical protein
MNKVLKHKFRHREVVICYNSKKEFICYILNSFSPNFKRVLFSTPTTDKEITKKFLFT